MLARLKHAGLLWPTLLGFAFGLLLTIPLRETFARLAPMRGPLLHYVAVMTVLGLSGLWEFTEALVAQAVSPELGAAYLGAQGDPWDAQRDIAVALLGSLLAVAVALIAGRRRQTSDAGPRHSESGGRPK